MQVAYLRLKGILVLHIYIDHTHLKTIVKVIILIYSLRAFIFLPQYLFSDT